MMLSIDRDGSASSVVASEYSGPQRKHAAMSPARLVCKTKRLSGTPKVKRVFARVQSGGLELSDPQLVPVAGHRLMRGLLGHGSQSADKQR